MKHTLEQVRKTRPKDVVFVSRSSALKLGGGPPVQFSPLADETGEIVGGVFACPRKGTVTLAPRVEVDAEHVLEFLRNHRLCEPEPGEHGFAEVAA